MSAALLPALAGARELATSTRAPDVKPFELDEMTIADLQAGMSSGKFTARSITEKYLARIDAIDKRGPAINSVIETNPDALAMADAADKERRDKGARGPLHGIPILIKDNIDTADRTETDGSVVCPASANGLVGIKPTLGLVSRSGVIPIAHSQDTPGPMARTVRDAAILLGALAGVDLRDSATAESGGKIPADYTRFLDPNGLKGARIGIARKYFGFSDAVDVLMNDLVEEMKRAGALIVDPADLESHGKFDDTELLVLLYELKTDLNAYLAARPGAPKSLKDLIDFNDHNKDKEMPYFGQDLFIKAQGKGPLTDKEYVTALE